MKSPTSNEMPGAPSLYYRFCTLEFSSCSGPSDQKYPAHFRLQQPFIRIQAIDIPVLTAMLVEKSNGKLQTWLRDQFLVQRDDGLPTDRRTCWRSHEGKNLCDGRCQSRRLHIGIPIFLVLNFGSRQEGTTLQGTEPSAGVWEAAKVLHPVHALTKDIAYDYVSTIYSSGSHHWCDFTPDGHNLFAYNDLKQAGLAASQPAHTTARIAQGLLDPNVAALVYRLRGGREAQDIFLRHQASQLKTAYNITVVHSWDDLGQLHVEAAFDDPGYRRLGATERWWMHNSSSGKFVDFEQIESRSSDQDQHQVAIPSTGSPEIPAILQPIQHTSPSASSINIHSRQSSISAEDTDTLIECRCGYFGRPSMDHQLVHGAIVQCSKCQRYSHTACQWNGYAELVGDNLFQCDICVARWPKARAWGYVFECDWRMWSHHSLQEWQDAGEGATDTPLAQATPVRIYHNRNTSY